MLLLGALAACSGDGDPRVLPTMTTTGTPAEETSEPETTTSSASTSTSPSAEPTPTTTLQLPDEHVPEVEALVTEFFAAYNAAQDSRDLAAFDALYLPDCSGCAVLRDELTGWLADGGTVEGADWVILQMSSLNLAPGSANAVAIAYRSAGSLNDVDIPQGDMALFNFAISTVGTVAVEDMSYGPADA